MEEDRAKKILYVLIGVLVLVILFVVLPSVWRNNQGSSISFTTDEIFKSQNGNSSSDSDNISGGDGKTLEELNEDNSDSSDDNSIKRDYSDPFYPKIRQKIEEQKYISEIYIPKDYYPSDNYVKNAAGTDGSIHVFKKQPILVYIPKNDYYDAITQAFVTYNNTFKGLISFNTVKNPNKAQIKIVLTDDFGNKSDIPDAIGLGSPVRFDKDGNILYSEVAILTKNKYSNEKMPLTIVYNTMLHELGHALGILGHSQDPNDVMYKEISEKYHYDLMSFSDRDIETFKIMYSQRKNLIDNAVSGAKQEKLDENLKYAQDSNDADSYLKVAESYYEMEDYTKALDAYKKALALNPDNYRIYLGLSYCYMRAKQYDYAITYGNYALKRAQTNEQKANCNKLIGVIYLDQAKYTDAYPYLSNALTLDSEDPSHFINYLIVCAAMNKHDLAKDAYNTYINNYNLSFFSDVQMEVINWAKN